MLLKLLFSENTWNDTNIVFSLVVLHLFHFRYRKRVIFYRENENKKRLKNTLSATFLIMFKKRFSEFKNLFSPKDDCAHQTTNASCINFVIGTIILMYW